MPPTPSSSEPTVPPFAHLHVHGPFSRLDAASSAEALCARAAALGMDALALTDHDTLSGAVPFLQACARHGLHPVLGAEVTFAGGQHLTLLCPDPSGYAALCRLLSAAHLGNPRGQPEVAPGDLEREAPHLIALSGCRKGEVAAAILAGRYEEALRRASARALLFGPHRFYLELPADRLPAQRFLVQHLRELGARLGIPTVATGNVHYAGKESAWVADLLACVRLRCRLEDLPADRAAHAFNAERYLKDAVEVCAAVGDPGACERARELALRCQVPLALGVSRTPRFPLPGGESPEAALRRQVEEGARRRHGPEIAAAVRGRLEHELGVIQRLGFADYFLCVADVARWARAQGIRVAGRGSAADSAVAYALGITDVDAAGRGHLFERFLSEERAEAPDIDLDFDARGRDRVAEYVVQRYGQDRVAAVAAHNTFGARAAVREIGRVLGFPPEELDRVSKRIPYDVPGDGLRAAIRSVPELAGLPLPRARLEALAEAVAAVAGLPRHLATHLGGLCVAPGAVTDLMPVQRNAKGVVVAQFDKRDLEALGLLKLDLLSLRTLGAVDDALRIRARQGDAVDYEGIPLDDPATFSRLRRGATVGVFQLESAAQMALQVRLGATELEDVIASVALIRPGPIKGNMVDPFVRRRRGREPVTYPHPGLEGVLRRTHGVVVYQEQVIAIATEVAGFTPGEADRLRRVMSHARSPSEMEELGALFRGRAVARGMAPEAADDIFRCLQGYASYGFPEAHAVAFGVTAYRTAYLAEHHPAAYFAGLLANQPMGFYPVRTLVTELRRRGVAVLPPDVNRSGARWGEGDDDSTSRLRTPLLAIAGMREAVAQAIVGRRRQGGPYGSLFDLCRRVPAVPRDALEALVLAGACDALAAGDGAAPDAAAGPGAQTRTRHSVGETEGGTGVGGIPPVRSARAPSAAATARATAARTARYAGGAFAAGAAREAAGRGEGNSGKAVPRAPGPPWRAAGLASPGATAGGVVGGQAATGGDGSGRHRPWRGPARGRVAASRSRASSTATGADSKPVGRVGFNSGGATDAGGGESRAGGTAPGPVRDARGVRAAAGDGGAPGLGRGTRPAALSGGDVDPPAEGGVAGDGRAQRRANRRQLLWSLSPLCAAARAGGLDLRPLPPPDRPSSRGGDGLVDFTEREKWLQEERLLGFSPRGHVMRLVRAEWDLEARGYLRTGQARSAPEGMPLSVAGVPVRPHRPPTRSGRRLVFLALEDEEGLVEVMVPEDVYRRDGAALFPAAPVLTVEGRARRRGEGMSLVADRVRALVGR